MAFWKSEQHLVTNGYSLLHGSSGSMIWAFPFGIWLRIFDERGHAFNSSIGCKGDWDDEIITF
jgi:hypothetical protein